MRNGSLPAVLGGSRIFPEAISLTKPLVCDVDDIGAEVRSALSSGRLTKGRHLAEYEQRVADYVGTRHAVAVSSCTVGLMLTYQALGLDRDVIMPSFTFMATAQALRWSGGTPVFVDVDPERWDIDPQAVESRITDRTCAIVAVHVFGNPAVIEALEGIARKHDLKLVFDAAHGFGSLHDGEPVGRYGDAEIFSTSPTKLLATGEGGVVTTNRDDIAEYVRSAREYGNVGNYQCREPGLNGRMPEMSAILGIHGIAWLERHAERRNLLAALYRRRLSRLPGLNLQTVKTGDRSSYKDFSLTVDPDAFGLSRDELVAALRAEGIDTRNYYDPPVHRLEAYEWASDSEKGALPVTDSLASTITSLPLYYALADEMVEGICYAMQRVHEHAEDVHLQLTEGRRSADSAVQMART